MWKHTRFQGSDGVDMHQYWMPVGDKWYSFAHDKEGRKGFGIYLLEYRPDGVQVKNQDKINKQAIECCFTVDKIKEFE